MFGPPFPFPVAFRVSGPDVDKVRELAARVQDVMVATPSLRQVNADWGERAPSMHFVIDQARLGAIGRPTRGVSDPDRKSGGRGTAVSVSGNYGGVWVIQK